MYLECFWYFAFEIYNNTFVATCLSYFIYSLTDELSNLLYGVKFEISWDMPNFILKYFKAEWNALNGLGSVWGLSQVSLNSL